MLEESEKMTKDCTKRLGAAVQDLRDFLVSRRDGLHLLLLSVLVHWVRTGLRREGSRDRQQRSCDYSEGGLGNSQRLSFVRHYGQQVLLRTRLCLRARPISIPRAMPLRLHSSLTSIVTLICRF